MTEQVATATSEAPAVSGSEPAPVSQTTTTTSAPAATALSLDEQLAAVYDKSMAERTAASNGKAPAQQEVKPVEVQEDPDIAALTVSTDAPEKAAGEPALSPAIAAPNSLSAEMKAVWPTLNPKAQEFIAQREKEAHAKISEQGNELKTYQPLGEVYEFIRGQGVPRGRESEVVRNWAAAQAFLDKDPPAGLKWLAESYGVDLAQVAGLKQPTQQTQPSDGLEELFQDRRLDTKVLPVVAKLEQRQRQLESQLMARQQAEIDAKQSQANAVIAKFKSDPSRQAYWNDDLEAEVSRQVMLLQRVNPRASMEQLLEEGYDKAVWGLKDVRERILNDQKQAEATKAEEARKAAEAEKAKKAEQAKKMAALNQRSGANASTPAFDGRWDSDDAMGAIYDRIQAGSTRR
jgi:hypothetical protein